MPFFSFLGTYFVWHYTNALRDFFGVWKNIEIFIIDFFSISILLKTLLSPWKRMGETYTKSSGLSAFFETLVINTIMRIVGLIIRTVILLLGVSVFIISIPIGIILFSFWLLLPLVILSGIFIGLALILSSI